MTSIPVSTNTNIHCILLFRIDSDKFAFFLPHFTGDSKKKEKKLFDILSILLHYDMELAVMSFPSTTMANVILFHFLESIYLNLAILFWFFIYSNW
jgi:hypothetical protein